MKPTIIRFSKIIILFMVGFTFNACRKSGGLENLPPTHDSFDEKRPEVTPEPPTGVATAQDPPYTSAAAEEDEYVDIPPLGIRPKFDYRNLKHSGATNYSEAFKLYLTLNNDLGTLEKIQELLSKNLNCDSPAIDPLILQSFMHLWKKNGQRPGKVESIFNKMRGHYPAHLKLLDAEPVSFSRQNLPEAINQGQEKISTVIGECKKVRSAARKKLRAQWYASATEYDCKGLEVVDIATAFISSELTHYTVRKALEAAHPQTFVFKINLGDYETHIFIMIDGFEKKVYTLYGGISAFTEKSIADPAIKRKLFIKKGNCQTKEYVKDDFGTFTPRFVYAVKSKEQIDTLQRLGRLRGRFFESHNHFLDKTEFEKASSAYHTEAYGLHIIQKQSEPILKPILKKSPPRHSSLHHALYWHVENGSGEGQRGVGFRGTKHPILSNCRMGFAYDKPSLRLEVDLAKIPPALDPEELPAVVNLYAKIGGCAPAVSLSDIEIGTEVWYNASGGVYSRLRHNEDLGYYVWSPEKNYGHYCAIVRKNKEIFVAELRREHIKAIVNLAPEDTLGRPNRRPPKTRDGVHNPFYRRRGLEKATSLNCPNLNSYPTSPYIEGMEGVCTGMIPNIEGMESVCTGMIPNGQQNGAASSTAAIAESAQPASAAACSYPISPYIEGMGGVCTEMIPNCQQMFPIFPCVAASSAAIVGSYPTFSYIEGMGFVCTGMILNCQQMFPVFPYGAASSAAAIVEGAQTALAAAADAATMDGSD